MKIDSVSVTFGETRSKNFQATRVDVGLSASCGDVPFDHVRAHLLGLCRQAVEAAFAEHGATAVDPFIAQLRASVQKECTGPPSGV